MEVRVQLKVCEGCGSLFYRAQILESVDCRGCEVILKDFPTPETRKRRGRPSLKKAIGVWRMAEAAGGAK